jgi:signal transduction histidine kinase
VRRPWYSYLLVALGVLTLLGVLFGSPREAPGARVPLVGRVVTHVEPGSPLDRAGLRPGDVVVALSGVRAEGIGGDLAWTSGASRADLEVERAGARVRVAVRPAPADAALGLARLLLNLINLGLVTLAIALFWQQPRDGRAVLLGLLLLSAPVLVLPPVHRLWALCLAAHFFRVFPTAGPGPRWPRILGLYGSLAVVAVLSAGLAEDGRGREALGLYHLAALCYAAYGLSRVLLRWRGAAEAERPVARTLTVAAGAILAAVGVGMLERPWSPSGQSAFSTLLPAALFSGAVGHLVFRLRALEVRVVARRTLQYLLARWTLGTLFLVPGFILVFHLGEISGARREVRPAELLGYLAWMAVVGMLLVKRGQVLQRLDRRFFRDEHAVREALLGLARELGAEATAAGVFSRLEDGIRRTLRPASYSLGSEPASEAALAVPLRRGGILSLGPKEDGTPYTGEERALLEAAAAQAATALENARLSAALLERQREELAARTAGMLAGQEEERRRLAADLHDQVLPELRQIAGDCERLRRQANGMEPELARLEGEVRGAMDSVREVMEALRPSALDVLGLGDALEGYLRQCGARREPPLTVSVRRSGAEPSLPPEVSLALYRICQEAVNNVIRHSGADRAGLEILAEGDRLTLAVWDDGRGFDPARAGRGHGLANIRQRAELIGAVAAWEGREGGGTRFSVAYGPGALVSAMPFSADTGREGAG